MNRRTLLQLAAGPLVQGQSARRPSILLISGWNLYNIGDVAITPGFLRLIQQHFSEAEVTVLLASYPKELGQYLKERFPAVRTMPNEFKAGQKLTPEMERAFRGADLLVLNSGMTLSYGYYGLEWERYIGRLLAFLKANELGVPFGIYGHSFDKVDPPGDILYRDVLNRAAFLYTRDSESLKVLRGIGVAAAEMGFTPDSTFGFDLHDDAATTEFLRTHNVEPGKFTAMVPRLDVDRFRKDGKEKEHAAQTRAILEAYVEAAQEPVVLVHEVTRMIEPVKAMVLDQLSERARRFVRYKPDYWMPDAAAGVYSKARMVVSMEMHSIILALAAGTPSIHPYFRQAGLKQWMMRDIGLPEWLIDQDDSSAQQIAGAMVNVLRDDKGARAKTSAAMDRVHRRQAETMAVVKRAALTHYSRKGMA
ncbi:MAG: polysaccharide pyruvyl transferase family protein [Acidobacteria bacterium]|nr:polysaccharide pyruvyl transferase family protein [Acidobacteriota bacterium]